MDKLIAILEMLRIMSNYIPMVAADKKHVTDTINGVETAARDYQAIVDADPEVEDSVAAFFSYFQHHGNLPGTPEKRAAKAAAAQAIADAEAAHRAALAHAANLPD